MFRKISFKCEKCGQTVTIETDSLSDTACKAQHKCKGKKVKGNKDETISIKSERKSRL